MNQYLDHLDQNCMSYNEKPIIDVTILNKNVFALLYIHSN